MGGGNAIHSKLLLNPLFVSAVTTPVTYLQDITEGAKLFGLDYGMWVLFGFVVLLTVIFGAYALRKLVKVRTQLVMNHSF